MAHNKSSVLSNNKYAILHANGEKHWIFVKDEDELTRLKEDNNIKDGDVVIELTNETVRVASQKNYIELQ